MNKLTLTILVCCAPLFAASCEQAPKVAEVGKPAPDFTLVDTKGTTWTLSQLRGQVVFVNFWATWCPPCREEMPAMQRLKEKMAGAPFALLAVNYGEGNARVEAFLQKVPVDFTILLDRDAAVSKRWQARVLPFTVVIDPAQRIRYTVLGDLDWSAPEVEATLRKLLPPR